MSSRNSFLIKSTSRSLSDSSDFTLEDAVIPRPDHILDPCPLSTTKEPLPTIVEKHSKKKKKKDLKGSTSTLEFWLKPGVSLPKLKAEPEANESKNLQLNATEEKLIVPSVFAFKSESQVHEIETVTVKEKELSKPIVFPLESDEENDEPDTTLRGFGPSKCQFKFNLDTSNTIYEEFEVPDETDYEPSHALKRWEEYVSEGKKLQFYLSRSLGRKPCDLLINQGEKFRKVCEDKNFFWLAQFLKPDKRRDCWWRPYPKQKKRAEYINYLKKCRKFLPARMSLDHNKYPEMEIIGTPLVIQKEKGLICEDAPKSVNSTLEFWEQSPYRQEQLSTLKNERKQLKHDVHMFEFVIVGQKIPGEAKEEIETVVVRPDIPKVAFMSQENELEECNQCSTAPEKGLINIEIDDENISRYLGEENEQTTEFIREINFGVNEVNQIVQKSMRLENKGTIALKYEWISKKLPKKVSLNALRPIPREPWFFFNKNSGVFLPGQLYNLKFYSRAKKPGVRSETWYLRTDPPMFSSGRDIEINLTAVAKRKTSSSTVQKVESYLNKRVAESIVKSILRSLFCNAVDSCNKTYELEYRSLFWERDLFEYHNPKHYYNSHWVQELKKLYLEIPFKEETEWDFSINSLISLVQIHSRHKESLNEKYHKIGEISRQLLRPKFILKIKRKVYVMAYHYLCKMANAMEDDYKYFSLGLARKKTKRMGMGMGTGTVSGTKMGIGTVSGMGMGMVSGTGMGTISGTGMGIGTVSGMGMGTISGMGMGMGTVSGMGMGTGVGTVPSSEPQEDLESKYGENESFVSSLEDEDEIQRGINPLLEIDSMNFQTMIYLKVYGRLCEAIEQIADAIETRKLFERKHDIDYSFQPSEQDVTTGVHLYDPFQYQPYCGSEQFEKY